MLFDWTDTAQKQRWSNFPQGLFTRDGLMWGNLSTTQQNAWLYIQLVLGPGEDGKTIQPEGLQVSTMTAEQQLLLALIRVRVGMLKEDDTVVKMAEIQANLEETWFAWYGPTTNGEAASIASRDRQFSSNTRPSRWVARPLTTSMPCSVTQPTIMGRGCSSESNFLIRLF